MKGSTRKIGLQSALLLFGQVVVLLTSAFWGEFDRSALFPLLVYLVLFASGGYMLADSRRWLATYLAAVVGAIGFGMTEGLAFFKAASIAGFGISYGLLFHVIVRHCFFKADVLPVDRILAGASGYLLLGFLWKSQFEWAGFGGDAAFLNNLTGSAATASEELYFAFVTLTSLGYGDIVPATPLARVLAVCCALSGALYLAIFISALMGALSSRWKSH